MYSWAHISISWYNKRTLWGCRDNQICEVVWHFFSRQKIEKLFHPNIKVDQQHFVTAGRLQKIIIIWMYYPLCYYPCVTDTSYKDTANFLRYFFGIMHKYTNYYMCVRLAVQLFIHKGRELLFFLHNMYNIFQLLSKAALSLVLTLTWHALVSACPAPSQSDLAWSPPKGIPLPEPLQEGSTENIQSRQLLALCCLKWED